MAVREGNYTIAGSKGGHLVRSKMARAQAMRMVVEGAAAVQIEWGDRLGRMGELR